MNKRSNLKEMFNSRKGQTLVFAMIIILVLLVYLPNLINLLRQENKMTVKHQHSTTAFHLAEAATDRGLWKLRESKDVWDSFAEGTVTGYNNDVTYEDIEGGTYKIAISTTSEETERKIIGRGRDSSTNEKRVIELIVEHVAVEAAVFAPTLVLGGNTEVHWGPIQATGDMTARNEKYPRKYAVGQIINRTPDVDGDPDTDGLEYWAHYSVPAPPGLNRQYYLEHADEYYGPVCDEWPVPTGGVPADFTNHAEDTHAGDDRIYFVDGDLDSLRNTYLKGSLIVTGNLRLRGGGRGMYDADIPENALDEYAACDGYPDPDDMPGHPGPPTVNTYTFGATNKVIFEGFIYIGGDWWGTGNGNFNGCVQCIGSTAGLTGDVMIYYNEDVAKQVETTELNIKQVSWKELGPSW